MLKTCQRKEEISKIINLLKDQGLILISGFPGIGKTSLLAGLKNELKTEYQYRMLELSCRIEWNDEHFYAALADQIRSLLGDGSAGSYTDPDTVTASIEKHGILVFMDDFQNVSEKYTGSFLRRAVKFNHGKIIACSRIKPEGIPENNCIVLSNLGRFEAGEMVKNLLSFHNVAKTPSDFTDLVCSVSQGHPYLIKMIIGSMLSGKTSVSELRNQVTCSRTDLSEKLIIPLWNGLDERQKSLLKLFSVIRCPVPENFASVSCKLCGTDIINLKNSFMIEEDENSYLISHDLMKEFVRKKMNESERKKYQHDAADILYEVSDADPEIMIESYFQAVCAENRETAEKVLEKLADFCLFIRIPARNLVPVFREAKARFPDEAENLHFAYVVSLLEVDQTDDVMKEMGKLSEWRRYFIEAEIRCRRGERADSVHLYKKSLEKCENRQLAYMMELKIAQNFCLSGENEKSFDTLEKFRLKSQFTECDLFHGVSYLYDALIYGMTAKFEKSAEACRKAEKLLMSIRASGRLAELYSMESVVLWNSKKKEEAEECARKALFYSEICNVNDLKARALSFLATAAHSRRDHVHALEYYQAALSLQMLHGDKAWMCFYLSKIGYIHTEMNNLKKAEECLLKISGFLPEVQQASTLGWIACCFTPLLILTGKTDIAQNYLEKASEKLNSHPQWALEIEFCRNCILLKTGNGGVEITDDDLKPEKEFAVDRSWMKKIVQGSGRVRCIQNIIEGKTLEIDFDFEKNIFSVDGRSVDIGRKKILTGILREIIKNPGAEIDQKDIFLAVWKRPFTEKDSNQFWVNICRLRKLLDAENQFRFIENAGNYGCYRFNPGCCYRIRI